MAEEYAIFGVLFVILWFVGIPLFGFLLKRHCLNCVEEQKYELFDVGGNLSMDTMKLGSKLQLQLNVFSSLIYRLRLHYVQNCSHEVQSRARNAPSSYLMKYANLNYDEDTLHDLKYCYDFVVSMELFQSYVANLSQQIYSCLPRYYRRFIDVYTLVFTVCSLKKQFSFTPPVFIFCYTSPAGRNCSETCIPIDSDLLEELIDVISLKLTKTEFTKMQRRLATPALKEAIKMRDDYTCCECGNSIYKEPNLLLEVDHIIPISKGGKTEPDNLQTLCWKCNRTKSNKIIS